MLPILPRPTIPTVHPTKLFPHIYNGPHEQLPHPPLQKKKNDIKITDKNRKVYIKKLHLKSKSVREKLPIC